MLKQCPFHKLIGISQTHVKVITDHILAVSVTENNVAIVVGCMPAFAKFVKLVNDKILSLRSRSKTRDDGSSKEPYDGLWETPPHLHRSNSTVGSPARKPARNYYELTETMLLETQVSVAGADRPSAQEVGSPQEPGIVMTTGIQQRETQLGGFNQSVEGLL